MHTLRLFLLDPVIYSLNPSVCSKQDHEACAMSLAPPMLIVSHAWRNLRCKKRKLQHRKFAWLKKKRAFKLTAKDWWGRIRGARFVEQDFQCKIDGARFLAQDSWRQKGCARLVEEDSWSEICSPRFALTFWHLAQSIRQKSCFLACSSSFLA